MEGLTSEKQDNTVIFSRISVNSSEMKNNS